jgi:hypothetical protein
LKGLSRFGKAVSDVNDPILVHAGGSIGIQYDTHVVNLPGLHPLLTTLFTETNSSQERIHS